jgi:hypothetical protein
MFLIFMYLGAKRYILVKKGGHSKFAPKAVEWFLLGYDSNTKAYRVFNKSSRLVKVTSDFVFYETNGSSIDQVYLDENEVPTTTVRTIVIGDVRPQEHQVQDQPSSSTMVQSPTQDEEQVPKDDGHPRASRVPKDRDHGGAQEQEEKEEEEVPHAPPTQFRTNLQ